MIRWLLILPLLAGCHDRQAEADKCWLRYGAGRMLTCLTAEYGWDSGDAAEASLRRMIDENR